MSKKSETKISISLLNRQNRKFDLYLLNSYALHKYKNLYSTCKTKVNFDIKKLSEDFNTVSTKDIRMLLISELLPLEYKTKIFDLHHKEFTNFM